LVNSTFLAHPAVAKVNKLVSVSALMDVLEAGSVLSLKKLRASHATVKTVGALVLSSTEFG